MGRRFVRDLNIEDRQRITVRRQDCLKNIEKIKKFGQKRPGNLQRIFNLEQKRGHFVISRTIFNIKVSIDPSRQSNGGTYSGIKGHPDHLVVENRQKPKVHF